MLLGDKEIFEGLISQIKVVDRVVAESPHQKKEERKDGRISTPRVKTINSTAHYRTNYFNEILYAYVDCIEFRFTGYWFVDRIQMDRMPLV